MLKQAKDLSLEECHAVQNAAADIPFTEHTIPGTKAPPVPGHALDLDGDDLRPFLRKK